MTPVARPAAVLLVRHAAAGGPRPGTQDHVRPLSPRGRRQAEGLVGLLAPFRPARILSSPSLRCVETVQPLAARLGLAVEEAEELAEGRGAAGIALVAGPGAGPGALVLCSHGDVVPELLWALAAEAVEAAAGDGEPRCQKGSTWVL
ncbi:MAG TPA: histidine phosphatase family protein, partial [Acidimicrobiales bacterium]|nr:histidine phosphatase family protein [Acidimicrobiales bacterium]